MDIPMFFGMLNDIILKFFQTSIWVVGFFYLLLKTIDNKDLAIISKYIVTIVLMIIFFNSIVTVYGAYLSLK
jgi:hypothetical protein